MKFTQEEKLTILTALETEYLERRRMDVCTGSTVELIQRFRKATGETAATRGLNLTVL